MTTTSCLSRQTYLSKFLIGFFGVSLSLVLGGITARAQSDYAATPLALAPGSPAGSYHLGDIDNVNLFNGNVNVTGTWLVSKACATRMVGAGVGGRIVNVSSQAGKRGFPLLGAYCAAKSAQWSLTNALRLQLADQHIRVAGLHVGYMDTDMVATVTAPKANPVDIAKIANTMAAMLLVWYPRDDGETSAAGVVGA